MRWPVVLAAMALGCPAPSRYAVVRPGLSCERATRVAFRTLTELGYTVTDMVPAQADQPGAITAEKPRPEGGVDRPRVKISCDAVGASLQPFEDAIFPNYEFSRAFDYSFTALVQRPDVEEPRAARGLEVLVQVLTAGQALLDLGGVPTVGGAVPVRLTVRNNTDRTVALDPARLDLVSAEGTAAAPLAGSELAAALATGPAAERLRAEIFASRRVAPHTTVFGFLVFPPHVYREARIGIEDVETEETEGFVAPVQ